MCDRHMATPSMYLHKSNICAVYDTSQCSSCESGGMVTSHGRKAGGLLHVVLRVTQFTVAAPTGATPLLVRLEHPMQATGGNRHWGASLLVAAVQNARARTVDRTQDLWFTRPMLYH